MVEPTVSTSKRGKAWSRCVNVARAPSARWAAVVAPPTAGILPTDADGTIAQLTETQLGTYELLYHFVQDGARPSRVLDLARLAFGDRTLIKFGWSVALSEGGSTLAIGARGEDSSAIGIGGDQGSDAAPDSGAVYLY